MRSNKSSFFIFLIIGAVFLLIGINSAIQTKNFLKEAKSYNGTVIDISQQRVCSRGSCHYDYYPKVTFAVSAEKTLTFTSDVSYNNYQIGNNAPVLYNEALDQARINDDVWKGSTSMVLIGSAFLLFSLIYFVVNLIIKKRKSAMNERLKSTGISLSAKITSTPPVYGAGRYGQYLRGYQIVAQGINPQNNQSVFFSSDVLSVNPGDSVIGQAVTVYLDPTNPKKYYMNISILPNLTN